VVTDSVGSRKNKVIVVLTLWIFDLKFRQIFAEFEVSPKKAMASNDAGAATCGDQEVDVLWRTRKKAAFIIKARLSGP
jgi:hypothetical protein